MLNIDSKRLRKALVEVSEKIKKFPCKIVLKRDGIGFNTYYEAEIGK